MTALRLFGISLICVALGYGPEISTYYVALLNAGKLEIIESAVKIEPCDLKTDTSVCFTKYTIDLRPYKTKYDSLSIGAGQIIYATRYFCNHSSLAAQYDDYKLPDKNFDIINTYQTYMVQEGCDTLEIQAWGAPLAVRKGKVAGIFVAGSLESVERVKHLSQFFRTDISEIFSFCFLFLFFISAYLRKAFPDLKKDMVDHALPWWILCAFSNAGVIQILFPSVMWPHWQNKFGAVCLLVCLPMTYLSTYEFVLKKKGLVQIVLTLVSCFLIINKNFAFNFCTTLFVIAGAGAIMSIKRRDVVLLILSVFILTSAFKIYGIYWLPNPMVIYFFIGIVALIKVVKRLGVTTKFSRFVTYISKLDSQTVQEKDVLEVLIAAAREATSLPEVTLLRILPDSRAEISRFSDITETFIRDSIPPAFAHSLSVRNELWHIKVGSSEFAKIKKVKNTQSIGSGKFFSILPIFDEENILGAVAVTGYGRAYTVPGEDFIEQRAIIRLLAERLKTIFRSEAKSQKNEWVELNNKFHTSLAKIDEALPAQNVPQAFSDLISSIAKVSVYIASLDELTRRFSVLGISGFDPFVEERFLKGNLYAHRENEQGPLAIAINKCKSVIISDVGLLKNVLHENSNLFFEKNNTLSCAGIPIFKHRTSEIWGILWIERRRTEKPLNLLAETALESIASTVSQYLEIHAQQRLITQTTETLQDFVPQHILGDVLSGKVKNEVDRGYILMLDLKGSTKVSLEKGSDFWLSSVKPLVPLLTNLAKKSNLTLQDFKWDAFIFTLSSASKNDIAASAILAFCSEAAGIIEAWYQTALLSVSASNKEPGQKGRFCISYGDTTRGFTGETTKVWTIIGAEIAAVTKMEDVCKKLDGVIFFDESAVPPEFDKFFSYTDTTVANTGRKIYSYKLSWHELFSSEKKAA